MAIFNQVVSGGGSSPAPADPMSLKLKVSNGTLMHDNTSAVSTTIDFTGVTTLDNFILNYAYAGNTTITGTAFRNGGGITTVNSYAAYYTFWGCTGITADGLTGVVDVLDHALQGTFRGCTGLTSADVSTITYNNSYGMYETFKGCTNLTGNISFDSLYGLYGHEAFGFTFANTAITSVSFPALVEIYPDDSYQPDPEGDPEYFDESGCSMFNNMLLGCSNVTVHFPSNFEERLGGWSSVQSGFGGTNTTVLFDLDPTVEPEPEPEEPEEPIEEP